MVNHAGFMQVLVSSPKNSADIRLYIDSVGTYASRRCCNDGIRNIVVVHM